MNIFFIIYKLLPEFYNFLWTIHINQSIIKVKNVKFPCQTLRGGIHIGKFNRKHIEFGTEQGVAPGLGFRGPKS